MRVPLCLDDRRLLEDEPFASAFATRRNGPKKALPKNLVDSLCDSVEREPGGIQAVDTWQRLAFQPEDSFNARSYALRDHKRDKKLGLKILNCFVKFFWYLFSGQDPMNVIRTLKLAGYTLKSEHLPVKLEDLPVKLEPYDDPFDVPMSPLTVLSDDGDDDIVPLSMTALPPGAMKRSRSPELQTGDIFADESPAPPAEASTLPPSDSVGALLPGAQSPSSSPVYQAHSTIRAVRPSTRGIKSEAKARQTREPQLRARPPVATTERQLRARPSAPADSPSAIRSASDRGKQPEGQNLPQRQLRSRPSMTSAIVSTPSLQERLAPPEKRRQIGVDRSAHVLQNTMSVPSPSAPLTAPKPVAMSDTGAQEQAPIHPCRPDAPAAVSGTGLQEGPIPPPKRKRGRPPAVRRPDPVLQDTSSLPPSGPLTAPEAVAMADAGAEEWGPIHPAHPVAPPAVPVAGLQEGPIPPPKRKRGRPPAARRPDPVVPNTSSLPPSVPRTAPVAVAMSDIGAQEQALIRPARPDAPAAIPVTGLQEGPIPPPKRKPGRPPAVRRLDPVLQDTLTLPRGLALTRALPQPIPVAPAVVPLLEAPETQLPDRPSAADGPAPIEQGMLKLPPSGRPELVAISDAADKRPREQHCTVGCVEPTGRRAIKYREHCKCSDPRKAAGYRRVDPVFPAAIPSTSAVVPSESVITSGAVDGRHRSAEKRCTVGCVEPTGQRALKYREHCKCTDPRKGATKVRATSNAAARQPRELHCTVGCVELTGKRAIKYGEHCKCSDPRRTAGSWRGFRFTHALVSGQQGDPALRVKRPPGPPPTPRPWAPVLQGPSNLLQSGRQTEPPTVAMADAGNGYVLPYGHILRPALPPADGKQTMLPHPPSIDIDIKPEPSDDTMRLLEPDEILENWLDRPPKDDDEEGNCEEMVLDLMTYQVMKPPLKNYPPIWAQSRQEICESLDWFRSYQGGVYQTNGSAKGYFLSGFSAKRDIFACDGKLIVSHGGGKAESITRVKGKVTVTPAEDQRETDKSVKALLETYKTGQPLVLLIDDKYVPFPFDLRPLDIYMTVLGFYKIVHAWTEYEKAGTAGTRVVRYKFAFQWMEGQGEPWWLKEDSDVAESFKIESSTAVAGPSTASTSVMVPTRFIPGPLRPAHLYFTCSMCGQQSAHVYQQAWTCLHSKCPAFWTTSSGNQLPEQLDYNPQFLAIIDLRPLPASFQSALSLPPPVLAPISGIASTAKLTKGWHCEKCGRLSCRSAWEEYRCPHCGDTNKIVGKVRTARALMSIPIRISKQTEGADSLVEDGSGIVECQPIFFDCAGTQGRRQTFVLPEQRGLIHLIKMPRTANIEVDNIFVAYQEQAAEGILRFRRWPLRSHKLRGSLLTNYFSQNSGEAYQYVGGAANTVPFEDAPSAVVQAHNVIEKRISDALQEEHRFNEVLSAGYMEEQSMAFHSDAERGLGPLVAGLSMGSPALMHFRLRAKHSPGRPKGAKATAMTVVLRHGDICVMEGHGVQDFYEHTVVPSNFRIAATARWISSEHPQPHVKKLST